MFGKQNHKKLDSYLLKLVVGSSRRDKTRNFMFTIFLTLRYNFLFISCYIY